MSGWEILIVVGILYLIVNKPLYDNAYSDVETDKV